MLLPRIDLGYPIIIHGGCINKYGLIWKRKSAYLQATLCITG
jgi:hypothetical protein